MSRLFPYALSAWRPLHSAYWLWASALGMLFFLFTESAHAIELRDISVRKGEKHLEVLLDFDTTGAEVQAITLGKPARIMLTLPGVRTSLSEKHAGHSYIQQVTVQSFLKRTRVMLALNRPVDFSLKREGNRIRLLLIPQTREPQTAHSLAQQNIQHPGIVQHVLVHSDLERQNLERQNMERQAFTARRITAESALDLPEKAKKAGPVSMDVSGLSIKSALMMMAESAGIDIVVSDQVEGHLTLALNQLPWSTALALILDAHGLVSQRKGDVLWIVPQRQGDSTDTQQVGDTAPLTMDIIPLKHARAETLAQLLNESKGAGVLSSRGHVAVDARTNQLLISDTPSRLNRLRKTLVHLDVPLRQVQIEARIVVARENVSRRLGVRWGQMGLSPAIERRGFSDTTVSLGSGQADGLSMGMGLDLGNAETPSGALGLGFINKNIQIGLELNAMELEGLSQTLSQPRIMTLDREPANIRQGQEIPYQNSSKRGATHTTFRDAVLALEVVPHIRANDKVLMKVDIQNDSVAGRYFNGLPAINTNRIKTQVVVDNGETVVLGGILSQKQSNDLRKIPWLGDLPGLGKLFRYAEKAQEQVELLVFLTPNIINE
ncbi:Type 3 secretion system secretin [Halomonadaceae bacterium LMG 33818]|uniref:type IV pilus secretin PilQ n=1 Tax=Cernens ardua TaxID=3402176 RepID=UPI003EDBDE6F